LNPPPKAVIRQPRNQPEFDVEPLAQLELPHIPADPDL
jgi:hypothetical protein